MSDSTESTQTSTVDPVEDPTPKPDGEPEANTDADNTPDDTSADDATPDLDGEAAKRELARARKEAAKYRAERNKLIEAEEKRKQAEMSELERAQAEAAAAREAAEKAEQARRTALAETAILTHAKDFADPSDAIALIGSQVEFDEADGRPVNVADLVKGLAEAKPHLLHRPPGGAGGNPHRPGGGEPQKTPAETYAEIVGGGGPAWYEKG